MKVAKVMLIALVAATALGFVVKGLWNALMPDLFGWHTITFWQGLRPSSPQQDPLSGASIAMQAAAAITGGSA